MYFADGPRLATNARNAPDLRRRDYLSDFGLSHQAFEHLLQPTHVASQIVIRQSCREREF
jgi:hypothetical protein